MLLALLGGTMVCSTWAANLAWVLMGVNWLLEGRWREKWQMAKASRLLHVYIVFYILLLAGMLWTENQSFGWSLLQVKLPLLCVPLVMLTSKPVEGNARQMVLTAFAGTTTVVSVIGLVRWLAIPDLPYRDIIPYISHIRFALFCCMTAAIVAGWLGKAKGWPRMALAMWLVWIVAFLFLIRSYTAFAVLTVASLAVIVAYRRRWQYAVPWLAVVGGLSAAVAVYSLQYYTLRPLSTEPLRQCTENGNPYIHACDGIVENGNYVNNYVCREELRSQWAQRSNKPYDGLTPNGYTVEPTLVRYLNSLGLTKDSAGVAMLSDRQVAAVEQGVANHVYESHRPLRKMVYTALFELEHYRNTQAVEGFTMLQRFELWRATWSVIEQHPLLGAGTGDVVDAMDASLADSGSPLAGHGMRSHNQYLGFLAALGVAGLAVMLLVLARLMTKASLRRLTPLMLVWVVAAAVSMLTEDTLDTLAGILLCTWFLAVRPPAKA